MSDSSSPTDSSSSSSTDAVQGQGFFAGLLSTVTSPVTNYFKEAKIQLLSEHARVTVPTPLELALEEKSPPPWTLPSCYQDVAAIVKKQILLLSEDEYTFLRPAVADGELKKLEGVLDVYLPTAPAALREDENLQAMRFKLVPSRTSEEKFWKNYFARVHVVKMILAKYSEHKSHPETSSAQGSTDKNASTASDQSVVVDENFLSQLEQELKLEGIELDEVGVDEILDEEQLEHEINMLLAEG